MHHESMCQFRGARLHARAGNPPSCTSRVPSAVGKVGVLALAVLFARANK